MTDKEHEGVIDWDQAIEDAIDADVTRLVVLAQEWKQHAELCGCPSCKKKAGHYEEEKNDAIYHWFADWGES